MHMNVIASQAIPAGQFSRPEHTPAWQVSGPVQSLLSLQLEPLVMFGLLHVPVPGSQLPAMWHWSRAVQETEFAPVQAPATQVSVCVHRLLSEQSEPSGLAGLEQVPVAGLHVPAMWH
jgi:hypothetical protein